MKILIVSLFNSWETHFAAELEIAQRHLDAGDEVEFLGCDGTIKYCAANPQGKRSKCDRCRLRRAAGLRLLNPPLVEHRLGAYFPVAEYREIESDIESRVRDVQSAEAFVVDGCDLGAGALSSAIWRSRDPMLASERAESFLIKYTKGATRSYLAVKKFLSGDRCYERAYVFNGRFGCTRGAFRACQSHPGLETYAHERGSSIEKISFYPNCLPHSREHWHRSALKVWAEANITDREQLGRAFYEERRRGVGVSWRSFTAHQQADLLPAGFDSSKVNVVIFNSSEDEFVGLGDEWKNPVYPSQSNGIEKIVTDALVRYPDRHFYLRMHPNLTNVVNSDVMAVRRLAQRGLPNFTLIEADSKVSSYMLLEVAERVISFGSTMGVEAAYWGKVSIQAGHSYYEGLDATYLVNDHSQLMDLIGASVEPKPQLGALQYGYFARTHGTPFRYWKAADFATGTFMGKSLRREPKFAPWARLKTILMDMRRDS